MTNAVCYVHTSQACIIDFVLNYPNPVPWGCSKIELSRTKARQKLSSAGAGI